MRISDWRSDECSSDLRCLLSHVLLTTRTSRAPRVSPTNATDSRCHARGKKHCEQRRCRRLLRSSLTHRQTQSSPCGPAARRRRLSQLCRGHGYQCHRSTSGTFSSSTNRFKIVQFLRGHYSKKEIGRAHV